ncbi:TPA: hypothetical protein ACGOXG_001684 [Streptococcus suis]
MDRKLGRYDKKKPACPKADWHIGRFGGNYYRSYTGQPTKPQSSIHTYTYY